MSYYLTRAWEGFRNIFGLRKNSKYVNNYINEANIRSSIYMAFIVIALEIWMIIRNVNKYVVPNWSSYGANYSSNFDLLYSSIGLYVLFIISSVAVLFFGITFYKNIFNKGTFITNLVISGICFVWPFLLFLEHLSFDGTKQVVNSITTLTVFFSMPLLGVSISYHTLYWKKHESNNSRLGMLVIICYSIICLSFGIKVGYSDFANPAKLNADGSINIEKVKMITCFFTMIIFVACLLIWKPFVSILILTTIFVGFMFMLKGYGDRPFLEADEINYITLLVALSMVTISLYQQRVTEAKKDEKLIHDAIYDHLGDIYNVKYLTDVVRLYNDVNPKKNENKMYLFLNIFNFRVINDRLGFETGDEFIVNFSKRLNEVFNDELVARLSDDHFVAFTSCDTYKYKIREVKEIVKELSGGLFINLKVGGYKPEPNESPNRAIDKARYACGMIKRKTEVDYMEYDNTLHEKVNKRQYIVNNIDKAVENGWIVPYYQPVVWSDSKELCGAEALARWIDPEYGFLSPADFIPVLEETRLIHKLDYCIIESVCKNMREALDKGREIVPISVNFSRLDFELMDVISVLEYNLTKYNIDKKYLHIEITESAISDTVDHLNKTISRLKEEGYSIWLDDFGSGYSSLNVLKDYDFDVIKIDMKFLSNFESNDKTKDILDCIVQLADRLNMKTLTEGVETKEQAEFLEKIGCGRLQGYLFGKPFKLEDFEDKIDSNELKISKNIL